MSSTTRVLSGLAVVLAGLVGVTGARPGWLAALGVGGEQGPSVGELERLRAVDADLEYQRQVVGHRLKGKIGVIRQLIEGRLTLLEAAARFRNINQSSPIPED